MSFSYKNVALATALRGSVTKTFRMVFREYVASVIESQGGSDTTHQSHIYRKHIRLAEAWMNLYMYI